MQQPETNDRNGERFYLDGTGTLRHCLPGEEMPAFRKDELIFSLDRELSMMIPVGAADQSSSAGRNWGGYCRLRCRLVLPHRFVSRHTGELKKGKTGETILADAVRDVLREEMKCFALRTDSHRRTEEEQTMWEQIRTGLYDRLLSEGWLQEEFRPGAFRLGGV